MRVLVCGGRNYSDFTAVCNALNEHAYEADVLIQGGARGADHLAREWAIHHDISVMTFNANWREFGATAGPIRNKQMLEEGKPNLVIAFPGGAGTANMVRQARAAGVKIIEVGTQAQEIA